MRTLVVCSGGLDSVTLSHKIVIEKTLIHLVSFDYGQRHRKELDYARRCATRLGITHDIIDITDIGRRLTGSALTDGTAVPDGHYAEETMRSTIVPNRNAIMLTIAFGVATVRRAEAVAAAVHGGDHFIYPRCSAWRSTVLRKLLSKRRSCTGVKPISSAKVRGLACHLQKRGLATREGRDIAAAAARASSDAKHSIFPTSTTLRPTMIPTTGSKLAARI